MQNSKGRNLVQIRADKEKKLGDIRNAFNKWVYIKKILDAQDILNKDKDKDKTKDDKEADLKKIKGFFDLMNGIDQFTKKEIMNNVLPKLEDYLKDQKGKGKLKKLVYRKPNYNRNLLRKYLYKWYGNAMNSRKEDENYDPNDERLENIKRNVFKNILLKTQKNQLKNILRKYFYKWLQKAIKMAIKEERDKAKDGSENRKIKNMK